MNRVFQTSLLYFKASIVFIIFTALLLLPTLLYAEATTFVTATANSPNYQEPEATLGYLTFNEEASLSESRVPETFGSFIDPLSWVTLNAGETASSDDVDLLSWIEHQEARPLPTEKYDRQKHYGSWMNDPSDASCYNTRGKVLARDSDTPVSNSPNNKCYVEAGQWHDPYSGQTFTSAKDIQIDHLVALKNSYISGAFSWASKQRCYYANYMGNDFHLLSVSGKENMKKLDYTPEKYMPPEKGYQCQYLKQWLSTKLIWNLNMSPSEGSFIKNLLGQAGCKIQDLKMNRQNLSAQRTDLQSPHPLCDQF